MAFDIAKTNLVMEETSEMVLKHPVTGEEIIGDGGKPVTFVLYGQNTAKTRAAVQAYQKKQNARGKRPTTLQESLEDSAELLAAVSVRAENMTYKDQVVDNKAVFKELYMDDSLSWILEQITAHRLDIENFMKA